MHQWRVVEADVGEEELECAVVLVWKFKGCPMLAEMENTGSTEVGSRTRLQRRRRQSGTPDTTALCTFSDSIDLRDAVESESHQFNMHVSY
jgi:hypothetical protein